MPADHPGAHHPEHGETAPFQKFHPLISPLHPEIPFYADDPSDHWFPCVAFVAAHDALHRIRLSLGSTSNEVLIRTASRRAELHTERLHGSLPERSATFRKFLSSLHPALPVTGHAGIHGGRQPSAPQYCLGCGRASWTGAQHVATSRRSYDAEQHQRQQQLSKQHGQDTSNDDNSATLRGKVRLAAFMMHGQDDILHRAASTTTLPCIDLDDTNLLMKRNWTCLALRRPSSWKLCVRSEVGHVIFFTWRSQRGCDRSVSRR